MWKKTVLVIVLVAVLLAGCSSGFQIGYSGVATKDIVVVMDYNTGSSYKPKCTINKGASVRITDFSTLSLGSGEKQGLIELSSISCTGWAFDDSSLSGKIK